MKKLTPLIATCTLFILLLSACTITKRHYMPGYYVNRAHHVNTTPAPAEEKHRTETTVQLTDVPPITPTNNNTADEKEKVTSVLATEPGIQHNYRQPVVQHRVANSMHRTISEVNILKKLKTKKVKTNAAASHNDDALSLLWIIILIILIVWAVGLLAGGFGIGGLIHVLLVIALVLLILWLLRIL